MPFLDMGALEDLTGPTTTVAPYAAVRGTVYDESGKPAAGIQVRIESEETKRVVKVTTDKNGKYSCIGLQTGDFLMGVVYMGEVGLPRTIHLQNGRDIVSDFDLTYFQSIGKANTDFTGIRGLLDGPDQEEVTVKLQAELRTTYDLAKDAAARGDFETAVRLLKELTEKLPNEVVFWRQLGEAYLELNRYSEAASAFRKAIELRPEVADYHGLLAVSLLFLGDIEEAERHTEKTAALDKLLGAEAYYNLGLALTDMNAVVKAEAAFSKAAELNPNHSAALYQLGLTMLSTHPNLKDAQAMLERVVKLAPDTEDAQIARDLIREINKDPRGTQ
jgi:Flp pilus assembly protein TadD